MFNPFLDLTKKKDEELYEDINKLNNQISYYFRTGYLYVSNQLSQWRDAYMEEIINRNTKKQIAKDKSNLEKSTVFDTFIEDPAKRADEYDPFSADIEIKRP